LSYARTITFAFLLFLLVIVTGTIGYMIIEEVSFLDGLYMVIITVSSVGYREAVVVDDPGGKIFTMIVIMSGLGTWTFLTLSLIAFLVESDYLQNVRQARIKKRIEKMRDHVIICGLGQAGSNSLGEIMLARSHCVVIEKNAEVAEATHEKYSDLEIIVGDATTDEVLLAAGVERACGLIAATESDSDNLLVVLTARSKNQDMVITSRASRIENYNKLRIAGANHVVMPNVTGGVRMAATLLRPQVVDFLEVMMRGPEEGLRIEQAVVPEKSPLAGQTLMEAAIPNRTGLLILAIKREGGEYIFNPKPTEPLQVGDVLIVVGVSDQTPKLDAILAGRDG